MGRALVWLLLVSACALAGCAAPHVYGPATALLHDDPVDDPERLALLSLTGRGFGVRGVASRVRLRAADGHVVLDASSYDRKLVRAWTDRRIVIAAPGRIADEPRLSAEVETPFAASAPAEVAFFAYRHFDVPPSQGTNPSPVAVAVDQRSRVYVNEEFHTQLKRLDPDGSWHAFDLPQGRPEGVFASHLFGDGPTRVATLNESMIVDDEGRAWASEAGWALYSGVHPNHSRILMIEPDGDEARIWPVPGDDNSVIGIAWDPTTSRLWFTQARLARRVDGVEHEAYPARLTSFDPRAIPPDSRFDFAPRERCEIPPGEHVGACSTTRHRRCFDDDDCVLADRVCADDAPDDRACFREHAIPTPPGELPLVLPGPLLRHSDGTLWYAGYWGGNDVGRFDPATQRFERYPLAQPPGEASCDRKGCACFLPEGSPQRPCAARCCIYQLLGRGPWGLAEDAGGGVAFCAQEAGAVSRLPKERFDDPRCAALDATGANPCLIEYAVPDFDPSTSQMHSLARDDAGNLWFGQGRTGARDADPARGASIGYVQAGTGRVILLPPLSLYPFTSTGAECRPAGEEVAHLGAGIAFDPRTSSVWFADFCRKRLGQIVPLPARDAR